MLESEKDQKESFQSLMRSLKSEGLGPTKLTTRDQLGRFTAIWHVDNDDDRWVRLETHFRLPGFLVTYFDGYLGVKFNLSFAHDEAEALVIVRLRLDELSRRRSPHGGGVFNAVEG